MIAIAVLPHLLDRNAHAHLAASHMINRVDQVEVGKLAIDSIVHDMYALEAGFAGVVKGNGALQRTALEGQASDE